MQILVLNLTKNFLLSKYSSNNLSGQKYKGKRSCKSVRITWKWDSLVLNQRWGWKSAARGNPRYKHKDGGVSTYGSIHSLSVLYSMGFVIARLRAFIFFLLTFISMCNVQMGNHLWSTDWIFWNSWTLLLLFWH